LPHENRLWCQVLMLPDMVAVEVSELPTKRARRSQYGGRIVSHHLHHHPIASEPGFPCCCHRCLYHQNSDIICYTHTYQNTYTKQYLVQMLNYRVSTSSTRGKYLAPPHCVADHFGTWLTLYALGFHLNNQSCQTYSLEEKKEHFMKGPN
jgi:hypothetical protein